MRVQVVRGCFLRDRDMEKTLRDIPLEILQILSLFVNLYFFLESREKKWQSVLKFLPMSSFSLFYGKMLGSLSGLIISRDRILHLRSWNQLTWNKSQYLLWFFFFLRVDFITSNQGRCWRSLKISHWRSQMRKPLQYYKFKMIEAEPVWD